MLSRKMGLLGLRLLGMKLVDENEGNWPDKCVVPTGPHTSNRDFPYGIFSRAALQKWIVFVGKASLFKWPLGPVLKWMGGVPVVREKKLNFVQSVAAIFRSRDEFRLCVAMEGTRTKVDRFKTGFYFIAKEANVPLVCCVFDFGNNEIRFMKPFYPTDDIRADFDRIYRIFDGVVGRVPANGFDYDPQVLDHLPEPTAN